MWQIVCMKQNTKQTNTWCKPQSDGLCVVPPSSADKICKSQLNCWTVKEMREMRLEWWGQYIHHERILGTQIAIPNHRVIINFCVCRVRVPTKRLRPCGYEIVHDRKVYGPSARRLANILQIVECACLFVSAVLIWHDNRNRACAQKTAPRAAHWDMFVLFFLSISVVDDADLCDAIASAYYCCTPKRCQLVGTPKVWRHINVGSDSSG